MIDVTAPANASAGATPRDLAVTAAILGFAGAGWFGWALSAITGWAVPLTIGAGIGVIIGGIAVTTAWRRRGSGSVVRDRRRWRAYFVVIGVQSALITAGTVTLTSTGQFAYIAPWILFVVGAHFVPLGRIFRLRSLSVSGVPMMAVAAGAALAELAGRGLAAAVVGIGGGLVMTAFGAWMLRGSRA